jgi:glycosyltransferase involved in cell wall biosynthesis
VSIEAFIISEILSMKDLGVDLIIIPRDGADKVFHKRAQPVTDNIWNMPCFNGKIAVHVLQCLFRKTGTFFRMLNDVVFQARNVKIALKNLMVLPKALYLAEVLEHEHLSHIHAHRGSTPSTMAYVIAGITGVPWSFTVHRFDIYEDNLLKRKVESSSFVRCISERGRVDLLKIVGQELSPKAKKIYMGVEVPALNGDSVPAEDREPADPERMFTIAVPASLLPVKGHIYLIEACAILIRENIKNFRCVFYGDGPLQMELKRLIEQKELTEYIRINGMAIPHEELMYLYNKKKIDIVILPSIIAEDGAFEGIPVSLMEAMAYMIPVISTDTGGIGELIGSRYGILLDEKDPDAITAAIKKLLKDVRFYSTMSKRGRERIEKDFNTNLISRELNRLFLQYSRK